MQPKLDFSVISAAQLTQVEFASLCAVNRVTVNLWVKGKMQPHRFHRDRVCQALRALERSVSNQELPLPADLTSAQRLEQIKAIVTESPQSV